MASVAPNTGPFYGSRRGSHMVLDADESGVLAREGERLDGSRARPLPSTDEMHIGKLKVALVANVSALIAGFVVVALVELSVPDGVPDELTAVYSVLSVLLIVIHLFATMIAVCILPSLELMLHHLATEPEETRAVREQYRRYRFYVDLAWTCSMGIGILLFLAELIVVIWVKISHISHVAATTTTALLAIVVLVFLALAYVLRQREGAFLYELVLHRRARMDAFEREQLSSALHATGSTSVVV